MHREPQLSSKLNRRQFLKTAAYTASTTALAATGIAIALEGGPIAMEALDVVGTELQKNDTYFLSDDECKKQLEELRKRSAIAGVFSSTLNETNSTMLQIGDHTVVIREGNKNGWIFDKDYNTISTNINAFSFPGAEITIEVQTNNLAEHEIETDPVDAKILYVPVVVFRFDPTRTDLTEIAVFNIKGEIPFNSTNNQMSHYPTGHSYTIPLPDAKTQTKLPHFKKN